MKLSISLLLSSFVVLVTQQAQQASSFHIQSTNPRKRTLSSATSLAEAGSNNSNDDDNDNDAHDAPHKTKSKRSLVIWDCDGVLVDSEALLKQGEVEALSAGGFVDLSVEDCVRMFSGVSPDQAVENFKAETGQDIPADFFPKQIEGSMDLFRDRLQPLMLETVSGLSKIGATQCIASGSPKDRVELCVDVAGMRPYFPTQVIYTRELVDKGKPAPDLFLYTAEKMGFQPEDCIVIEDSSSGIQAAQAAGMEVLGFLGGGHATADWYRKEIFGYGIPVVEKEQEVYDFIVSRTVFMDQKMAAN
jgi:beta-phosphoglucomutase-like phosphatase (HAD superfamily)